jgi:hypothetical protein
MAIANGIDPKLPGAVSSATEKTVPSTGAATLLSLGSSGFVVQVGNGRPTNSATKGSLHINATGSGTTDRLYVNTTGGTAWASMTSAS